METARDPVREECRSPSAAEGAPTAGRRRPEPGADDAGEALANVELALPTLPSDAVLRRVLDNLERQIALATDARHIKFLSDQLATAKEWARRMDMAFDGQNRFAELELRSARRLGEVLRATVKSGRPRKRSTGTTVSGHADHGLPAGVTRDRSSKCQRIAAIDADKFEQFIAESKAKRILISERRALRVVGDSPRRRSKTRRRPTIVEHDEPAPAEVIDAVARFLAVDVLVGEPTGLLPAAKVIAPALAQPSHLRGDVFVATCPDPAAWLEELANLRLRGPVAQVILALRASTGAAWFKLVERHGWSCCFPSQTELLVAYHGPRHHGFWTTFQALGAVLFAEPHNQPPDREY